ncbi:MAG: hypothetical protein ACKORF_06385 [Micrococcales bacterium]
MHLKPGPLVEASAIYGITWIVSFIVFALATGFEVAQNLASVEALLILLPAFTLWAGFGWLLRNKAPRIRFFANVSVSSVLALGIAFYLGNAAQTASVAASVRDTSVATTNFVCMTFYFVSVAAAAFTQFYLVKPRD